MATTVGVGVFGIDWSCGGIWSCQRETHNLGGTKIRANASTRKVLDRRFFAVVKENVERWMSASAEVDATEDEAEHSSSGVKSGLSDG